MTTIKIRRQIGKTLLTVLLLFFTFFIILPFLWTAVMSFRTTKDILENPYGFTWPPNLKNYIYAFTEFGFMRYTLNSVFVTVSALIVTTIVTSMAAFGFARQRFTFRLREPIFYLIFLSMMFPPQITLLSLFQILVNYHLYNTLWGLVLVYSASALPLNIFLLRTFFSQIPQDLEDAARIDGCNDWRMFWKVMFPIAQPALATTLIFNFIIFWNDFLYAVTFVTRQEARTLPLAMMFFMGESWTDLGMLASGLMVSILPVMILYLILSEQFIKGMTAGALKGV